MSKPFVLLAAIIMLTACALPTPTALPPTAATPTATPAPTATLPPTATPTATLPPTPTEKPLSVDRNAEWAPHIQEFNGVNMALVPAGCFTMGQELSQPAYASLLPLPARTVCITKPYWIDVTEVTNEQVGGPHLACTSVSHEPEHPHVCVRWQEAVDLCGRRDARLPTEAEWKFAGRGPDSLLYPWGSGPSDIPNGIEPVGQTRVDTSWVGVMDLAGNADEWMHDIFATQIHKGDNYPTYQEDPQGPELDSGYRVIYESHDWPLYMRGKAKYPGAFWNTLGFRCAMDYAP